MAFKDCNGVEHGMYKFPTTTGKSGKTYCKARRCVMVIQESSTHNVVAKLFIFVNAVDQCVIKMRIVILLSMCR